jgi:cobyrinic acid a,c-diamide synthase
MLKKKILKTNKKYPRLIIAGTSSSSGKTTVTSGLIRTLINSGFDVRAYKIGPDYIDTGYLAYVSGNTSYNLDRWLMGEENIKRTFIQKSCKAGISIIEGVMGLFDGGKCSTAEIAKILDCPVILCINASKTGESIAAVVEGFINYDKDINIAGVIINMVSGEDHFSLIKIEIEKRLGNIVLGFLESDKELNINERHLGLVTVFEKNFIDMFIEKAAEKVSQRLDIKKILKISEAVTDITYKNFEKNTVEININVERQNIRKNNIKVFYSFDRAFNFFYKQNIEILEESGASCIPFSPLEDTSLKEEPDLIILWGGFPEIFIEKISGNNKMIESILSLIYKGVPVYAECGGLIYLSESFIDNSGQRFPLAGVLPVDIKMDSRLTGFGYKMARTRFETILGNEGLEVKGHEFHHTCQIGNIPDCCKPYIVKRAFGDENEGILEGYAKDNIFATYIHMHFLSNLCIVRNLLNYASIIKTRRRTQN